MDWLATGFAELMGLALGRACLEGIEPPEEPPETMLHRNGVPGRGTLAARAGEGSPDYFLTGSWFVDGPEIVVEALLLRSADERWMAVANWRGPVADVLTVPAKLAKTHLEQLGLAYDPSSLAEIGRDVPRSLPAAAAFFRGLAARDAGDHAAARARFLESVAAEGGYVRARREALRATILLGREAEAASFALESAKHLEHGDRAAALEFLWEASRLSLGNGAPSPVDDLERIDRLAREHEVTTGEAAALRKRLLAQIAVLADAATDRPGPELLARAEDRWLIWTGSIDDELERRARLRGVVWVQRDGRWVADALPEPTVAMWRIRALLDLARRHSREGRIEAALERYRQIVGEHAFLEESGLFDARADFYWTSGIRLEAHFMMLRHLKESGRLVRDRTLHPRIIEVGTGGSFVRDFTDTSADPRARVWSRHEDGGHEYFDFAAPVGRQIDRVRVETRTAGVAWLDLDLSDPKGWPPQFSLSRRLDKRRLPRGESIKTYDLPRGTLMLSASVLWGPRWVRTLGDALAARRESSADGRDIAWLKVTFETSPVVSHLPAPPSGRDKSADRRLFEHHAGKWGWEEGRVVRANESPSGVTPPEGSAGKTWLAFEVDGDLLLVGADGAPGPELPPSINAGERESGPRLLRTHEGDHALLWRHGPRDGVEEMWIASTKDFGRWGVPRRVIAAAPSEGRSGRDSEASGPIAAIPGGYLMLLGGGETRYSPDLARWGPPRSTFAADGLWKELVRTDDGRVWAVLTRAEAREIPSGGQPDPAFGFYGTADGRTFEKHVAVLVSTSRDGSSWTEPSLIHRGAEPTGLWAFPVARDRIAVVAGYGNLDLRVLATGGEGVAVPVTSPVRLPMNGPEAVFFSRAGKVWCARVVHDFISQESAVLFAGSGALSSGIEQAVRRVVPGSVEE